ncbi:MAG: twin transmembrane helix small protein [Alphaproteobacteria bacterium]|nr:twin transmembrane helix small protein [Alphaproteobacteria bacterium]
MNLLNYLGPLMMGAVFLVLCLGLFNMMRGGNSNRSQNLMRWRVGLQFVAIVFLIVGLWWSRH